MSDAYDPADNSYRSWQIGIAAWREICIRKHVIEPDPGNNQERRWWDEGPREPSLLDTVRESAE